MGKTIVFGGSGFLGGVFLEEYPETLSVGRTIPKDINTNRHIHIDSVDDLSVLDDLEIDNVIFLIGNSNHHLLNGEVMKAIEYNVIPLKKALAYFEKRKQKIKKFVFFTTILLYGNESKGRPVHEDDKIYPNTNEYVFSKYLAEEVGKYYADKGMKIINVRISNIYGACTLDRPDLIPKLIKDVLTLEAPTIWSDKPIRDFIYASDAAEAVMKLLKTSFTGIVNIGSGNIYSVGQVAHILEKLSGKRITSLNLEVSGVMEFKTDIKLLRKLTGWDWTAKHNLSMGLEKAYKLMKEEVEYYEFAQKKYLDNNPS